MAYEKPIKIREAIEAIQEQEFILPSIQREFVWTPNQIELLFDSIMRDYPISTFLFWKVKAENLSKFKFYRFLSNYHERDRTHNEQAELSGSKDRMAILDGQQRLTSLYIGLKGSDARKLPRYGWKNDDAFPAKKLYINLLKNSEDSDKEFDFRFLSDHEIELFKVKYPNDFHWFKAGDILDFTNMMDIMSYLMNNGLTDTSRRTSEQTIYASTTLTKLYQVVNEQESINFYLEKSEQLDKVLHIFIRINSGGTKLSYSDLLLSIATAQWKKKDARVIIHSFVDKINAVGNKFNFNKDLVLKSCLVLTDLKDIRFRVDNFSTENMAKIENEWDNISKSLLISVKLINHFGFSGQTLTATNAIVPIAYFLNKNNIGEEILHHASQGKNRALIKEWLIRALLKKIFGGSPDNLYPTYRTIISENIGTFPLQILIDKYKGTNKSLEFQESNIEHLLTTQYGSSFAFMVLGLLYPLNHDYTFHQDHIHPKSFFNNKGLEKMGIVLKEDREEFINNFNSLPNLQLIEAIVNIQKSAKPLNEWLKQTHPSDEKQNSYKLLHFFPEDENLELVNFMNFFNKRKELLKEKLMTILNVPKMVISKGTDVDAEIDVLELLEE
ncbi:DUF262 domain-containing protein [Flavobacterium sp. TAB 87]|uniref:DUF262 domain-containing protein n=1 Tax=Flavobacterium sp. TAB 87 TaxID=1729581 RepID=UPI00076D7A19|nr:DUF262 domain-containing protein [Flavobacterium sp. TAB 87]KVV14584.1 hypothetical protein AP058_01636 [Flavobacterium sp. TAB 87]